jgi:hypothetical protein
LWKRILAPPQLPPAQCVLELLNLNSRRRWGPLTETQRPENREDFTAGEVHLTSNQFGKHSQEKELENFKFFHSQVETMKSLKEVPSFF